MIAVPVAAGGDGLDATSQASASPARPAAPCFSATPGQVSTAILRGLKNLPVTVTTAEL